MHSVNPTETNGTMVPHVRCVTMINPATTGWFEIAPQSKRNSIKIANIVEQQWFARYPKPTQVTFNQGAEFMKDFHSM